MLGVSIICTNWIAVWSSTKQLSIGTGVEKVMRHDVTGPDPTISVQSRKSPEIEGEAPHKEIDKVGCKYVIAGGAVNPGVVSNKRMKRSRIC